MTDRDDLTLIHRLMGDALPVLFIQSSQGVYPYVVKDGEELRLRATSMSTNSMICYALASVGGLLPDAAAAVGRSQTAPKRTLDERSRSCLAPRPRRSRPSHPCLRGAYHWRRAPNRGSRPRRQGRSL